MLIQLSLGYFYLHNPQDGTPSGPNQKVLLHSAVSDPPSPAATTSVQIPLSVTWIITASSSSCSLPNLCTHTSGSFLRLLPHGAPPWFSRPCVIGLKITLLKPQHYTHFPLSPCPLCGNVPSCFHLVHVLILETQIKCKDTITFFLSCFFFYSVWYILILRNIPYGTS